MCGCECVRWGISATGLALASSNSGTHTIGSFSLCFFGSHAALVFILFHFFTSTTSILSYVVFAAPSCPSLPKPRINVNRNTELQFLGFPFLLFRWWHSLSAPSGIFDARKELCWAHSNGFSGFPFVYFFVTFVSLVAVFVFYRHRHRSSRCIANSSRLHGIRARQKSLSIDSI